MRFSKLLLTLALAGFSVSSVAGVKQYVVTTISWTEGWAYSAMGEARFNDRSSLFCQFFDEVTIGCVATSAAGYSVSCRANAVAMPGFARNVRAMNSASFVALYWDPAHQGTCTDMHLIQGSQFLPDPDFYVPYAKYGTIYISPGVAAGVLSAVRYNNANPNEFISCEIQANGYMACMARDNAGTVAACHATEAENPSFADAVRSINELSRVIFHFDPASGVCSSIDVYQSSHHLL